MLTKRQGIMIERDEEVGKRFNNRDISWLYFNGRVLEEAARSYVPLLEKLNFLGIFSSNLDEFYRVRIPVLYGWRRLNKKGKLKGQPLARDIDVFKDTKKIIKQQQECYGIILTEEIIPQLNQFGISLHYNEPLPLFSLDALRDYYYTVLASYIHFVELIDSETFFPLNNELYFYLITEAGKRYIVNIPSSVVSRFKTLEIENRLLEIENRLYVFFIDDIIKHFIQEIESFKDLKSVSSFKITREAELEIEEEAEKDLADALQLELSKRDFGLATRLLYQKDLSGDDLKSLLKSLDLKKSNAMPGGNYHNLKDFSEFPVKNPKLEYRSLESAKVPALASLRSEHLFDILDRGEILLHTPYHSYHTVIRFFNEASLDPTVEAIYTTVYRLAKDSRIGHALLNAAKSGKKVYVFVELKARFDEANNIQWAKRLREAGVEITYSIPKIKVHAKVALVTRQVHGNPRYYGLLSTGNLNENTAKIYADHSLLTAEQSKLTELAELFKFLRKRRQKVDDFEVHFESLLVAHFNLYNAFLNLINGEINEAQAGRPALIQLKMNNLEEETLIEKLYAASQAGVKIELIIRGICRLIPGKTGLSENIRVKRVVGRFLEHSRIFYFLNGGKELFYMGSSDWMIRNIYNRIEVCFPITSEHHKNQLKHYFQLQWEDDVSSTWLDQDAKNVEIKNHKGLNAQEAIYTYLANPLNGYCSR